MDFWDLTKLMVRRWYISVPLLLATFAGTGYTAIAVEPDYAITAYVQLIPPAASSDPDQATRIQNPWLALGMTSLNNAAMVATQDQTFLDALKKKDDSASFEITIGERNPVATIAVVAPTQQEVESATALVTSHYDESVRSLQAQYGVKPAEMITVFRLDKGENIKRPGGKVKRAVIAVFAIGLLMTGGLTILIDALLRRRHRRDATTTASASDGPDFVAAPSGATNGAPVVRQRVSADPPYSEDSERTRPLGQYALDGARKADRDAKPAAAPRLPPDATIVLPRMPRAGEGGTNQRGRRN
ncbi:hypothetical protein HC028_14965 [Planosporangium flavigriseum]|nr:hypothetical protein [Planosporangium flavigriseum]NJC65792.1 hypothetical protein [Planosporangium flavigriseum]